jgi:long-chain acyl-CoA synthetase
MLDPLARRDLMTTSNLLDLITDAAEEYGDSPYLLSNAPGGTAFTFRDVLIFTRGCAALLDERGVPVGARVAMTLHNSPLACLLFLGVIGAQRVLVPLNPKCGSVELDSLLAHARPSLVIGHEARAGGWIAADGLLDRILQLGQAHSGEPTVREPGGALDAEIVYTSGSTGAAKGVVLSHQALLSNSLSMAKWAQAGRDDVFLNVVPLFHAGGQSFPTLTPLWVGGRTACVRPETALVRFWSYTDRYMPTWTLVVNAYLANLVERPERPRGTSLKGVLAGGSALGVELIRRFESTFDIPVHQVYGMTEMTSLTTVESRDRKPGDRRTAGPPVAFARVRTVDSEGRDIGEGVNGEILLSGPAIFTRYEQEPELTAQRLADGWVRSGDLGHLNADGELSIVDRIDSMVIVNGENVYPAEIENVVPHLAGVADAVVAALPHPVTGVELVLVYTLLPGVVADDDDWRATMLRHLSEFKVPRRMVPLAHLGENTFPKTPLGKIRRPYVQKLALQYLT